MRQAVMTMVQRDYAVCSRCGFNYDAGELRGGVCDDCRKEAEEEEAGAAGWEKTAARCIKEQADGQMALMPAGMVR